MSSACRPGPEVRAPPRPTETTGHAPPQLLDGRFPAEAVAKVPGLQRPCLSIPLGGGRRAACMPVPRPHRLCSQPSASRAEGRWRHSQGDRAGGVGSFVFRATGATSQCGHYRAVTACGCMTMGAYVQFAGSGQIAAHAAAAHTPRRGPGRGVSHAGESRRVWRCPRSPCDGSSWPPPLGLQSRTVCLSGQQGTDGDVAAKAAMKLLCAGGWGGDPRGLATLSPPWAVGAMRSGGRLHESGSFTTGPSRKRVPASSMGCAGQRGHEHVGMTRGPGAAGWEVPAGE